MAIQILKPLLKQFSDAQA